MFLVIKENQAINLDRVKTIKVKYNKITEKYIVRILFEEQDYIDIETKAKNDKQARDIFFNLFEDIDNARGQGDSVVYGLRLESRGEN